jgi:hypothetical protein
MRKTTINFRHKNRSPVRDLQEETPPSVKQECQPSNNSSNLFLRTLKWKLRITPATNEYQALKRLRSCKNSSTVQLKEMPWLKPFDPRLVHVRCGGKSGNAIGSYPRIQELFPVSIISPMLHTHFYPNATLTARTNCVPCENSNKATFFQLSWSTG